jgi:hypothetical protein
LKIYNAGDKSDAEIKNYDTYTLNLTRDDLSYLSMALGVFEDCRDSKEEKLLARLGKKVSETFYRDFGKGFSSGGVC